MKRCGDFVENLLLQWFLTRLSRLLWTSSNIFSIATITCVQYALHKNCRIVTIDKPLSSVSIHEITLVGWRDILSPEIISCNNIAPVPDALNKQVLGIP